MSLRVLCLLDGWVHHPRRAAMFASVVVASVVASLLGCSDSTTDPPHSVEMFSWWVSGGEVQALNALLDVHRSHHPEVTINNLAADYADQARDQLANRMAAGNPPDTFQANIGWGLMGWAPTALEPLDELAAQQGWMSVFQPAVIPPASQDGHLYGVALNIHRINALFYNKQVLSAHGIAPPTTVAQLSAACTTLKAAGITPIAMGNIDSWPLSEFAFESMFPGVAGGEVYEAYFKGLGDPRAPQLLEALNLVLQLSKDGCFNADRDSVSWTEALDRFAKGTAAFSQMGDWAKGYLESQGVVADQHFGVVPFPGAQEVFVFTSDTFNLPRGAPHRQDALALLATMGSAEGQLAFNKAKGSIPARTDINPNAFDSMQKQTYSEWKSKPKALATSGLIKTDVMRDLNTKLRDAIAVGDIDLVTDYLANNYDTLRR